LRDRRYCPSLQCSIGNRTSRGLCSSHRSQLGAVTSSDFSLPKSFFLSSAFNLRTILILYFRKCFPCQSHGLSAVPGAADDRFPSESSTYPLSSSQLMAQRQISRKQNVVFLGVSTSQFLLMTLVALSLLVLAALLWMNHRTRRVVQPLVVSQQAPVLCPVDAASRPSPVYSRQLPARAPPTFLLPSNFYNPDPEDSGTPLMARPVADSAEDFR
jgi:hypothetical protein